jgi:hypothetical protein
MNADKLFKYNDEIEYYTGFVRSNSKETNKILIKYNVNYKSDKNHYRYYDRFEVYEFKIYITRSHKYKEYNDEICKRAYAYLKVLNKRRVRKILKEIL